MPQKITISEGLQHLKTLRERHSELVGLRNQNSKEKTMYYGANADKTNIEKPVYDVVHLDSMISGVAREIRKLELAIKKTNAITEVLGYEQDDSVLGELKPAPKDEK